MQRRTPHPLRCPTSVSQVVEQLMIDVPDLVEQLRSTRDTALAYWTWLNQRYKQGDASKLKSTWSDLHDALVG